MMRMTQAQVLALLHGWAGKQMLREGETVAWAKMGSLTKSSLVWPASGFLSILLVGLVHHLLNFPHCQAPPKLLSGDAKL